MNVSVIYHIFSQAAGAAPVEHPARTQEAARDPGAVKRKLEHARRTEPGKTWWATAARVTEWKPERLAW